MLRRWSVRRSQRIYRRRKSWRQAKPRSATSGRCLAGAVPRSVAGDLWHEVSVADLAAVDLVVVIVASVDEQGVRLVARLADPVAHRAPRTRPASRSRELAHVRGGR